MKLADVFPGWALRRAQARARLEAIDRLYTAARPSRFRSAPRDMSDGTSAVGAASIRLWAWSRHLDQNYDVVSGLLNTLAYQSSTITVVPMVAFPTGRPAEAMNARLRELWMDWVDVADLSGQYDWISLQSEIARTWHRDGEMFQRHHLGSPSISYEGPIPYALEPLEPDLVPLDDTRMTPSSTQVIQGVHLSETARPVAYSTYTRHPGSTVAGQELTTITVPASQIDHLAWRRRLHQIRGVTVLAPIIERMANLRDYEESEEVAAKLASTIFSSINRAPELADGSELIGASGEREAYMQPGVMIDDLAPGETVQLHSNPRPSSQMTEYRHEMIRAICAAAEASYSTVSGDYDGTYSSQRQQLVEIRPRYQQHRDRFVARSLRPTYRRFVLACQQAGLVPTNTTIDETTMFRADYLGPPDPWVDPLKEAQADSLELYELQTESKQGLARRRGRNYDRVRQERELDPVLPAAPGNIGASVAADPEDVQAA